MTSSPNASRAGGLKESPNPVIDEHDVTVYQGDVREQLAAMPDGSVQCVVTSPPYYGLRDYGVDGQLGLEPSPGEYVETMRAVFADVRRVLTDDGVLWLNLGDSYSGGGRGAYDPSGHLADGVPFTRPVVGIPSAKNLLGIPWRVAFALQDDGWTLRNAVIWAKPNGMPSSVTDRLSSKYEHVFLFSKSRKYWFDLDAIREPHSASSLARFETPIRFSHPSADNNGQRGQLNGGHAPEHGVNPGDVWTIATSPFPGAHFAVFPSELARRCILAGCPDDGTVLDPFAGSGTTLKVARSLGRKSIGIELNPAYIEIIRDRIGPTPFDFGGVA